MEEQRRMDGGYVDEKLWHEINHADVWRLLKWYAFTPYLPAHLEDVLNQSCVNLESITVVKVSIIVYKGKPYHCKENV